MRANAVTGSCGGLWKTPWTAVTAAAALDVSHVPLWTDTESGRSGATTEGDAVVAHPVASMLVALVVVRMRLGVGPDEPAVTRPRYACPADWSELTTRANLVAEQELACWVGKVARALTWDRALRDQAGEFADAPYQNLAALLVGPTS